MTLLFDTHTLLWASLYPEELSPRALALISDRDSRLYVSAASLWEISTKVRLGKLHIAERYEAEFPDVIERAGYHLLDLSATVCLRAARLAGTHGDPFDRLLAAQALELDAAILSRDRVLDSFGIRRLW